MKKKTIAILVALMLLGGCATQTPAPADVPPAESQDMEAIIQQAVDEALREKMAEYEEEQQKKDQEIAKLKKQLEELAAPPEVPPASTEGETTPTAPASQPEEVPSQPEIPPQPEPEPAPSSSSASAYDPYNLKNMYPGFVWENISEEDEEETNTAGCFREDDALEVVRLTNLERENHGLDPLPIDEDLMELARIRAMEIREKYSHTRPDGTSVVDLRCGENCGQNSSAKNQVEAWMNSEGHRTNILLDRYHHIGVGCYQAPNGNLYWVQVFSLD